MTPQPRNKQCQGISSAVGVAIMIAIVFTTIVPLLMYQSYLQTLPSSEINSRRIRDIDRATEDLDVLVEADQEGLSIVFKNKSPLMINVIRIWALNAKTGTPLKDGPCLNQSIVLQSGWNLTVEATQYVSSFTGTALFVAVTERGRLFSSNVIEIAGGRAVPGLFPYTLTISVVNMRRGDFYQVKVIPLSVNSNIDPRSIMYKATASNENISLAFSSTAGLFEVSLYENAQLVLLGRLISPDTNPREVFVPDVTSVVFSLRRVEITPAQLDVFFLII